MTQQLCWYPAQGCLQVPCTCWQAVTPDFCWLRCLLALIMHLVAVDTNVEWGLATDVGIFLNLCR